MNAAGPFLSLPARSVWAGPLRPAAPREMLAALPAEAGRLRGLGAGALEFLAEVTALDERYTSRAVWREAAAVLAGEGLAATLHLPFGWVDLAALDREIWEGGLRSVAGALAAMEPLGPRLAALHPGNYATQMILRGAAEADRPELFAACGRRLTAALARLRGGPLGEVVALENLEGVPFDLIAAAAGAAGVGVCLDVGHALAGRQDPAALVGLVADRLTGLHLHDAVPGEEPEPAHKPLGDGCLDLARLVAALAGVGFTGPLVLEIAGGPEGEDRSARAWQAAFEGSDPRPANPGGRR